MVAINEVLENAKTMEDKFDAYVHRMLCQCGETRDYALGVVEGIKILSMYGLADIPLTPSIADIAIEKMRVKLALRNRSYSHLISLPIKDAPMFELFGHVTRFASFASKEIILKIVSWRAIRFAIENGINRHLPGIIVPLGVAYNKQGEIKKAYSLGNVAVLMAERFRSHKGDYACSKFAAYAGIMCQLESFKSVSETLLPCINDLKLVGNSEMALGCSLSYFNSCFAAGLPLTSLLDSNLIATEEFAERTEKPTFVATFQMQRQFLLNLKKKSENPTEFNGEAFREEETLSKMDGAASKMTLRDSSSYRLQLAFIFWDEDCMTNMLRILAVYPNSDVPLARLYNRLCFVGLASFAMGKKRNNESFLELGEDCLSYFKRLAKLFSFNARPIYSLLKAMKYQTKQAFEKAIERCMESEVTHLKAIASERYGVFLLDHDDATLAEDYITSAYWFYCDWGAHAKAAKMKHDYLFLRSITRRSSFTKKLTMASSCRTDIQPSKDKRQSLSTRLLLSNPNFAVNFHKRK